MLNSIPNGANINEAHKRISPFINRTTVLSSSSINEMFGGELLFKCENFQKAGAFKSRGAVNAVFLLNAEKAIKGVCTHSSGNHAQALARAASLRKIPAYIVMPSNAPQVKVDAVKEYGGQITFCEPTLIARETTLAEVKRNTGAYEIHPYDNYDIIAAQATAVKEMLEDSGADFDLVLCPVGGGGLLAGTSLGVKFFASSKTRLIACEPIGADDAFKSFAAGKIIPSVNPETIADGLLTSLGERNFPIIQENVERIVTVTEEHIVEAMRLIYERMKIIIEPSSAVPLAAIIENKVKVKNMKTGIIISGGNVDLAKLPFGKMGTFAKK